MKKVVKTFWQSRAPSERRTISIMLTVLIFSLCGWVLYSATKARGPLSENVMILRSQAVGVAEGAAELSRLRALPQAVLSTANLRDLLLQQLENAGLSDTLLNTSAQSANHVEAVFGVINFSQWLKLIEQLHAQNVRVESAVVETLATPGLVSITATLIRVQAR